MASKKAAQASPSTSTPQSIAETSAALLPFHDLVHQTRLLRDALESEKRRVGFFLGAGCPLGIYDDQGKESIKHIPDVAGLTQVVCDKLAALQEEQNDYTTSWGTLTSDCRSEGGAEPNVEHILTQLRTICALKGSGDVNGMNTTHLRELDVKICEVIAKTVGIKLPNYVTSYHRLAAWISHIDRPVPLEVFTPNYDLLIEEAFESSKVPFFDGFIGAREPFFDIAAMEQDLLPPRWTRLWKMHGSINWIKRKDESVYRSNHEKAVGEQLLIYPSHLKYDQSRRMPYLAMIDRFRAFFRDDNAVLVICGYSFADDHLNEVLLNGLRANRSAQCFALMYESLGKCDIAATHASRNANLTVLAWDGAVIGMKRGGYKEIDQAIIQPGNGIGRRDPKDGTPTESMQPALCRLGDFHYFALFLEEQFGVRMDNVQST